MGVTGEVWRALRRRTRRTCVDGGPWPGRSSLRTDPDTPAAPPSCEHPRLFRPFLLHTARRALQTTHPCVGGVRATFGHGGCKYIASRRVGVVVSIREALEQRKGLRSTVQSAQVIMYHGGAVLGSPARPSITLFYLRLFARKGVRDGSGIDFHREPAPRPRSVARSLTWPAHPLHALTPASSPSYPCIPEFKTRPPSRLPHRRPPQLTDKEVIRRFRKTSFLSGRRGGLGWGFQTPRARSAASSCRSSWQAGSLCLSQRPTSWHSPRTVGIGEGLPPRFLTRRRRPPSERTSPSWPRGLPNHVHRATTTTTRTTNRASPPIPLAPPGAPPPPIHLSFLRNFQNPATRGRNKTRTTGGENA
ncbi:hypothetical protein OF83DRAFT_483934 [Amylostereum chailletii]|nr:hypothetical protein OF83DRAFT_483934 [Amylostereum chailletii]